MTPIQAIKTQKKSLQMSKTIEKFENQILNWVSWFVQLILKEFLLKEIQQIIVISFIQ